jgi:glycosyltransferase involved in cell wall biosynthesis
VALADGALDNRTLRICLFGDGSSIHVRRWAGDLAERGCAVAILSPIPAEPMAGVTVHVVRKAPPVIRQLVSGADAWRFLRRFRPDIVHVHYLSPGPRLLWSLGAGRLVLTPYGTDIEALPTGLAGWVGRRVFALVLPRARAVIAASEYLLRRTLALGLTDDRALRQVVGFGVDCGEFAAVEPPATSASDEPMVIGYAKGLRDYYGPLDLLDAAARLRDEGVAFRLRIAGGGPLEATLRDQIARRELGELVQLMGALHSDELPAFFAGIHVFAMPSHREGYGVAALEASASGKPVVATNVGGIPEVVRDGATGLLVPPHDPPALAAALRRLAAEPDLRRRMGEAGRHFACERHGRSAAVSAMIACYRGVSQGSPPV